MRKFYEKETNRLSKQFKPDKFYVHTTDTDRSYYSAMANLIGMFGLHNDADLDEDWEQVKAKITNLGKEHPFVINQVSLEQDMLVYLKDDNCLRWA